MRALFFDEPEKPVVSQVQSPSITPNEVMIRSRRVGICHSDYELLAGRYIGRAATPKSDIGGDGIALWQVRRELFADTPDAFGRAE